MRKPFLSDLLSYLAVVGVLVIVLRLYYGHWEWQGLSIGVPVALVYMAYRHWALSRGRDDKAA